jgi:hypothetical protein
MSDPIVDMLILLMPGLKNEATPATTEKHLPGKHNQKRHGWRYSGDTIANARSAMRGQSAGERAEYRKRAGMQEPKKVERPKPKMTETPLPKLTGSEKQVSWAESIRAKKIAEGKEWIDMYRKEAQSAVRSGKRTQEQADKIVGFYERALTVFRKRTEASYFIDRRNRSTRDVLEKIMEKLTGFDDLKKSLGI